MDNNCVFCKIINGDIPSATVYEDNEFKVILDRFPSNEGHLLILPKEHCKDIFDIDPKKAGRLFELAVKVSSALKDTLGFENMNLLQNNGIVAGQTVFHFHLHLIPRYENDRVDVKWEQLDLTDEQIQIMKDKISANIN